MGRINRDSILIGPTWARNHLQRKKRGYLGGRPFLRRFPVACIFVFSLTWICSTNVDFLQGISRHSIATYQEDTSAYRRAIIRTEEQHVVFFVIGGVRSWYRTREAFLRHLVQPVCPPTTCVASIITHTSQADNRPDLDGNDPVGHVLGTGSGVYNQNNMTWLLKGIDMNMTTDEFHSWIHHYPVSGYDMGSPAEKEAMDVFERDFHDNATLLERIRVIRFGDPRRYSMWFARAFAWHWFQEQQQQDSFKAEKWKKVDAFIFSRPDLLWMLPAPSLEVLKGQYKEAKKPIIWVHDSYYDQVPDTWAFFLDSTAVDKYFSMLPLMDPGVACLGGPSFNESLVASRLRDEQGIVVSDATLWCSIASDADDYGWSEKILQRRLEHAGVKTVQLLPMATAILRSNLEQPKSFVLECETLAPFWQRGRHAKSLIPIFTCLLNQHQVLHRDETSLGSDNLLGNVASYPFQIKSIDKRKQGNTCLAYEKNHIQQGWREESCSFPIPANQLFGISSNGKIGEQTTLFGFSIDSLVGNSKLTIREDIPEPTQEVLKGYEKRYPHSLLYTDHALADIQDICRTRWCDS